MPVLEGRHQVNRQIRIHPMAENLIAWWPFQSGVGGDVASFYDAYNGYRLVDSGAVPTTVTGKIGNAAHFASLSGQDLTGTGAGLRAALNGGDRPLCFVCWAKLDSVLADSVILGNWANTGKRMYALLYNLIDNRLEFQVSTDGTNIAASVLANALGAPSVATYYFIACWHDPYLDTINISVNNGTVNSTSHSTGIGAFNESGGTHFDVGSYLNGSAPFDGSIDELGAFSEVPSSSKLTWLYNGGAGRSYPFAYPA